MQARWSQLLLRSARQTVWVQRMRVHQHAQQQPTVPDASRIQATIDKKWGPHQQQLRELVAPFAKDDADLYDIAKKSVSHKLTDRFDVWRRHAGNASKLAKSELGPEVARHFYWHPHVKNTSWQPVGGKKLCDDDVEQLVAYGRFFYDAVVRPYANEFAQGVFKIKEGFIPHDAFKESVLVNLFAEIGWSAGQLLAMAAQYRNHRVKVENDIYVHKELSQSPELAIDDITHWQPLTHIQSFEYNGQSFSLRCYSTFDELDKASARILHCFRNFSVMKNSIHMCHIGRSAILETIDPSGNDMIITLYIRKGKGGISFEVAEIALEDMPKPNEMQREFVDEMVRQLQQGSIAINPDFSVGPLLPTKYNGPIELRAMIKERCVPVQMREAWDIVFGRDAAYDAVMQRFFSGGIHALCREFEQREGDKVKISSCSLQTFSSTSVGSVGTRMEGNRLKAQQLWDQKGREY